MSGQTYKTDGRSSLQIQLKTGSGVAWSTVGSGSGWIAELRPEGSPSVTNASATFNIAVSGDTMTLTIADPSPLLRGSRTSYGWALYDGNGAPILTDMVVELHDGYTHPSGTPSPSAATEVGTYTVDLGTATGNLVTTTVWTGPQGPQGPKGDAGSVTQVSGVNPDGSGHVDLSGIYVAFGSQAHDAPGLGLYFPEAHGSKGDAVTDDAAALNAAASAADAAGGGTVWITKPHLVKSPVQLPSKVTLNFVGPQAQIIRNFSTGGVGGATIRNADQTNGNSDIAVKGGRFSNSTSSDTGKHFGFVLCTDVKVDGSTFLGVVGDWNTVFRDCTGVQVSNVYMDSGTDLYSDGLHFDGCQNVAVDNCIIACGDDCISITQTASATHDMAHIEVSNCYLKSRQANGIKVEVASGATGTITDVNISNVSGSAAAAPFIFHDINNNNQLVGVTYTGGRWGQTGAGAAGARIATDGTGASHKCSQVTVSGVTVAGSTSRCMDVGNPDVLRLTDMTLLSPSGAGNQCMLLRAPTNAEIKGLYAYGAPQHGVQINGGSSIEFIGGSVQNSTNNAFYIQSTTDVQIRGMRITGNAVGVQDAATATRTIVAGCNMNGQATPFNLAGTGSYYRDCPGANPVGVVTVAVPASGSAVAGAAYDRDFYVTANTAGSCTMAISNGPTITIPAGQLAAIQVPAKQTVTPTYAAGQAPSWVVEGR